MDKTPAKPDPNLCRRAVLVRLSHLGDVVHALPVFHALRAAAPGARIAWAVQSEFADLVRGLPGLERIVLFDRRGGLGAWRELAAELAAFAPEIAIDAQGNWKSAVATRLSRAPRRVGLHRDDWREPLAARLLTETASPTRSGPHAVDRMLHLARHVAGEAWTPPADWLALDASERARGRELWRRHLRTEEGAIVVQLSTPGDVRALPLARQVELLRLLAARGLAVLALSGPAEAELGRELEVAVPQVRHWVAQRGLRELASFLAAGAESGARFVGVDSGPLHLAAAAGLPTTLLAGPQDPARTGPWPPPGEDSSHTVVRAANPPECAPCLARRCDHPRGPVCMSEIEVENVLRVLVGAAGD